MKSQTFLEFAKYAGLIARRNSCHGNFIATNRKNSRLKCRSVRVQRYSLYSSRQSQHFAEIKAEADVLVVFPKA